jgi:hypothetical protein
LPKPPLTVEDLDFNFENTPVKMIANRRSPEIKVAGETIGQLEEGNEFQVKYWIALELSKSGVARFHVDEKLDLVTLHKLYWRETIQSGKQISMLPENFYPKLRRYLEELKESTDPSKAQDYEKATRLAHDIINCRLRKIVGLASGPAQTEDILGNLTGEERIFYNHLFEIVSDWRSKILK